MKRRRPNEQSSSRISKTLFAAKPPHQSSLQPHSASYFLSRNELPLVLGWRVKEMSACNTLIRTSQYKLPFCAKPLSPFPLRPLSSVHLWTRISPYRMRGRPFSSPPEAIRLEDEPPENSTKDTVEHLLTHQDDVARLMKMERRSTLSEPYNRWFPYLDRLRCGNQDLSSEEVLEAVAPIMMEERKQRLKRVVMNRSYSVCLVVEGLNDFGNVSAAFRSADALGLQSVHVVSCDSSKRYRDNRHVSMGAEKWLDIELWNSPKDCFDVLKSRGYRIATTHVGMDAVSIYDMDWSCPTAIVVGNENRGISDEALELSDLHCSIPMNGMVDSFNVSVAAGILMHHAVCDRTSRLGRHGDLTEEEQQILLAEFSLRHRKSALIIAHEYAKQKAAMSFSKL